MARADAEERQAQQQAQAQAPHKRSKDSTLRSEDFGTVEAHDVHLIVCAGQDTGKGKDAPKVRQKSLQSHGRAPSSMHL